MAKNISQIFAANPKTVVGGTDLIYLGVGGVDAAIQGTNLYKSAASNANFNTLTLSATSNHIVLSTAANTATINAASQSAARIYSIPDAGANANFVMTEGSSTITGSKTFTSNVSISASAPAANLGMTILNSSTTNGSKVSVNLFVNNSTNEQAYFLVGHQTTQQYTFGYDGDTGNALVFSVGSTLGSNNAAIIDSSGAWTFPNIAHSQTLSSSGATTTLTVENTSNTASSNALLKLAVGGTSANDPYVLFSIPSGTSYTMGADNSDSDALVLSVGTALGTANALRCDSSGRLTYATQPRFWAYKSSSTANATGDGFVITIIQDTEVYDVGSWFDNSTGIATAPVTGTYLFGCSCYYVNLGAAHTSNVLNFVVNSTDRNLVFGNPTAVKDSGNSFVCVGGSRLFNLTAGDTVKVQTSVSGGTKVVTNAGSSAASNSFWGMLVA